MKPFSELTGRARRIEVLRWLCVLPAAVLGVVVVQILVGAVVRIAGYGGWGIPGDSNIAYCLRLFFFYVPAKSAFVIAGAKMAPRRQLATAIVLALFGFLFSLMTHVVRQHLTGNRVGIGNYTHFFAESAAALGGAAYILVQGWRNRRTDIAVSRQDGTPAGSTGR
jgi:hypothetical protein